MNKAIEIGRLTRDPEVRYSQGSNTAVARYMGNWIRTDV